MTDTPSILPAPYDSHTHLSLVEGEVPDFEPRLEAFLHNGGRVLDVGIREGDEAERSAFWREGVYYSLGIHPNESQHAPDPDWDRLEQQLRKGASAIGETGLDFFRSPHTEKKQREWFRNHLELSRRTGLPVIIHCREAAQAVLEEVAALPPAGGIMHCFSEDWDVARKALDLGLMISFAGNLTYPSAQALRDAAAKVPGDRLLVETDAPFLAPVPNRGKKNHPDLILHTLRTLAEKKGWTYEEALHLTRENFLRVFLSREASL